MPPAIKVENLGKRYQIGRLEPYYAMRDVLTDMLTAPFRWLSFNNHKPNTKHPTPDTQHLEPKDHVWALKDVSFEVKHGEVVGIIGRNGAGKTTLLKLLSRITEPTEGYAKINGRVGSLLEVGTGFHPELTGRENVYLNGAVLGMTRKEIDRKFDEIVAFAEVEKFLDTPVKRYSSGMQVRLAFAVAAHLEPEILLVDEVLAVGDASFQKKCLGKMGDVVKEGRTVVFVSHQMASVENLCDRTILLESGIIEADGNTPEVIREYLRNVLEPSVMQSSLAHRDGRSGSEQVRFTDFYLEDSDGNPITSIQSGKDVYFVFGYEAGEVPLNGVDVGFSLHSTKNNQMLAVLYSSYQGQTFNIRSQKGTVKCRISNFPFSTGRYRVGGRITVNNVEADWPRDGIGFINVVEGDFYGTGKRGFGGDVPFLISGDWCLDTLTKPSHRVRT